MDWLRYVMRSQGLLCSMFRMSEVHLEKEIRSTNKFVLPDSLFLTKQSVSLQSSSNLSFSPFSFISPPSLGLSLFLPNVGLSLLLHPSSSSSSWGATTHAISISSSSLSFRPRELCYMLLDAVSFVYDERCDSQRVVFRIGGLQVDNGNSKATFPVVVRRVGKMRISLPRPSMNAYYSVLILFFFSGFYYLFYLLGTF
jgi:hypothetical protein